MVKFYSICVDAFPETKELKRALKKFQRVNFICAGGFTTATMTSIISGTVGSQNIEGGIGANTSYLKKFLEWRKDGTALTDLIIASGQDLVIHNHVPWMSRNIVGKEYSKEELSKHYRDHQVANDVTIKKWGVIKEEKNLKFTSTNPDLTLNTFVEWGDPEKKKEFYQKEALFFNSFDFNGLVWTDLCHWHEAVYYPLGNPYHSSTKGKPVTREDALVDSVKWLQNMDFEKEDAVYFIWADHGHRVETFMDPASYITWGYWKDNRKNKVELNPILSSYDLYPLILNVLNIKQPAKEILGILPINSFDKNRIYYTEDGRSTAIDREKATVYVETKIDGDQVLTISKVIEGASIKPGIRKFISRLDNPEIADGEFEGQKITIRADSNISSKTIVIE